VQLAIIDTTTGNYWNGSIFDPAITWHNASGTTTWSFASLPSWATNTTYRIKTKATDNTGNVETAGLGSIFTFDVTAPTVTITGAPASVSSTTPFQITLTFNESVTGLTSGEIAVSNGSASNLLGSGAVYTVDITPDGLGNIQISLPANAAQDAASNNNTASSATNVTYDATVPNVTISGAPSIVNSMTPFQVTLTFTEAVTGLTVGEVAVSNGSASNLLGSGASYTVDIAPNGAGNIQISLPANAAQDAALNNNTASSAINVTYDATAPTVVITGAPASVNSMTPFQITLTFNEAVTGLTAGEIAVSNGSASNLLGSGASYTADITPDGLGNIQISLPANAAQDAASNNNTASVATNVIYDATAPTVVISGAPASVNSTTPFQITLTFNETVTGLTSGEIAVSNGSASNLLGSGAVYTADITPNGAGNIQISLPANAAQDAASNNNTASSATNVTYDATIPSITITGAPSIVNSMTPFQITLTFSEPVTGLTVGEIAVSNGSASNLLGSGASYTADITPNGAGNIQISLPANAAQDASLNNNTASSAINVTYDATAPTVVITGAPASVNSTTPFQIILTFNEAVTGLTAGEIAVSNGSASNLLGSGASYTADITPNGLGNIQISLPTNAAQDGASNNNTASTATNVTYDATVPTVTITGAPASRNGNTFPISITFSEPVTGFTLGEISLVNATASNFNGSGASYTADITPNGAGNITIDIPSSVAQDAALNNNTAAAQVSVTYDVSAPSVAISGAPSAKNSTSTFPITITFNESVTGFIMSDISLTNATASNFSGSGSTYTADITPTGAGNITISVAASVAADAATNNNTASTTSTVIYDVIVPTVAVTGAPSSVNSTSTFPVSITFSEIVTSFTISDVIVTNGSVSNFNGSGASYTADITPSGAGTVNIAIPGNAATDLAGNNSTVSIPVNVIYDATAPTVTITGAPASRNGNTFTISVNFSEIVSGFTMGDIALVNATASNFAGTGSSYSADITPTGAGHITIDIAAGVAQDGAFNNNTASAQINVIYDMSAPSVNITGAPATKNNTSMFTIGLIFSEPVTGFILSDISLTNATASNFSGSGVSYTADITPTGAGNVSISVAASIAQDAATNNNTASAVTTVVYDAVPPTVSLTSALPALTAISPIPVTVVFSEPVSGFSAGRVVAVNGNVINFQAVNSTTYTFDVTPLSGGVVSISVPDSAVADLNANYNIASSVLKRTFDNVPPASITMLTAVQQDSGVKLSWSPGKPFSTDVKSVRIIRKLSSAPDSINGGLNQPIIYNAAPGLDSSFYSYDATIPYGVPIYYGFILEDSTGNVSTWKTASLTLLVPKSAPVFGATPSSSATEDFVYVDTLKATDAQNDPLKFIASVKPAAMVIDSLTGIITWTPHNSDVGPHPIVCYVSDGSLLDTIQYVITVANVNDAPIFSTPTTVDSVNQGSPWSFTVAASDSDANDSVSYSLLTSISGLTIANGKLSWTPDNNSVGTHSISVMAADKGALSDTVKIVLKVVNMNDPPNISAPSVPAAAEDSMFTITLTATDPDQSDLLLWKIIAAPANLLLDTLTGKINWIPSNNDVGAHTVKILVKDMAGATDTVLFSINVQNRNDAPELSFTSAPASYFGAVKLQFSASDSDRVNTLDSSLVWNCEVKSITKDSVLFSKMGVVKNSQPTSLSFSPFYDDSLRITIILKDSVSADTISSLLEIKGVTSHGYLGGEWHLAALPSSTTEIPALLADTNVVAFKWLSLESRYLELSAIDTLHKGKAFWIYSDSIINYSISNQLKLMTAEPCTLLLDSGWNMITSPYSFAVRPVLGTSSEKLFKYTNGDYVETELLTPWEGCFFFSDGTPIILDGTPDMNSTVTKAVAKLYKSTTDW
ncbi:MAG: hypothetical protein JNL74_18685, partial [Fibrobacteres bacterium]|nr:hypothetical protein [Fibrobacterota bacterium]